jgi:hypothetical protein
MIGRLRLGSTDGSFNRWYSRSKLDREANAATIKDGTGE